MNRLSSSRIALSTRGLSNGGKYRGFTMSSMVLGPITHIKSKPDFYQVINDKKLTVVDFFADWCGPCKAIAPRFKQYSEKYPAAVFIKVDVDGLPEVAAENDVRAMPTFQLFKEGNRVAEIVGANPQALQSAIEQNLD